MKIIQAKDYQDLSRKAANLISSLVTLNPETTLGLATGSTPVGTYEELVRRYEAGDLNFSGVKTVNLDEYCGLDGNNDQSYRYFMNLHLFSKVNIQLENTHVPDGTAADVEQECKRYDKLVEAVGPVALQVLGLGHNGHIGFNEPDDHFAAGTHCVSLGESTIEANARFFERIEDVPKQAITMGIRTIMRAKRVLLIVSGKEKEGILKKALFGPVTPEVPASILQFHPDLTVIASDIF